jgi:RNA polymerase sigma-B factor
MAHSTQLSRRRLAARNHRISRYRTLVRPIAVHYARCSDQDVEDLSQVGLLGLLRAAERFDREAGTSFEVFARPHIRGAILHYLRDIAPIIRRPRRQVELEQRARRVEADLWQRGCGPVQESVLAAALGLSECQWQRFRAGRQLAQVTRLNQLEVVDRPEPARDTPDERGERVMAALADLEPSLRQVVVAVVIRGRSLRQVAGELQVSPMTVHRRLRRGLAELSRRIGENAESPAGLRPVEPRRRRRDDPARSVPAAC